MARTKPWPTSSAAIAATSQVAVARSAMASSRRTRPPREQLEENGFERQVGAAHLRAKLGERAERNPTASGHEQDAVGNLLGVAELMNTGENGRTGPQRRADGAEHVPQLERIEGAERL